MQILKGSSTAKCFWQLILLQIPLTGVPAKNEHINRVCGSAGQCKHTPSKNSLFYYLFHISLPITLVDHHIHPLNAWATKFTDTDPQNCSQVTKIGSKYLSQICPLPPAHFKIFCEPTLIIFTIPGAFLLLIRLAAKPPACLANNSSIFH